MLMIQRLFACLLAAFLLLSAVGCSGESSQTRQRRWSKLNELTSVDLMEQSAEALKKQYYTLLAQSGDPVKLLPMIEESARMSDCIDWEDFYSKNKSLQDMHDEVTGLPDRGNWVSYLVMAQSRRSQLTCMRTEPRLQCARINLSKGDKQAARNHLRKLLEKFPAFIADPQFMLVAWQAYEPHDIEFQVAFREATEVSARQPGIKDKKYHIWWLDQVLTQTPADGKFKFDQEHFPKRG